MSNAELDDQLVIALRRCAENLFDHRSLRDRDSLLREIVAAAVAMVPGAVGGGVLRMGAGEVRSSHATDDTIQELDELQAALGEGPCVTAATSPPEAGAVLAGDLGARDAERWPRFAPSAVERGYRSILSTHLPTRPGGPRSALNLYAARAHAFDEHARVVAGIFAVQAATLLHGADEAYDLSQAIETRDVIGRAKGILMERFAVDDPGAFQMLVSSSQETNVKLVDVARWLAGQARTGEEHDPVP